MVDREILARAFYGEDPPPPPWATDCPVRFDVWLAFAKAIQDDRPNRRSVALAAGDLADHERVDVILSVNDEYGPARLLQQLHTGGTARIPELSNDAYPIAAGSYLAALVTFQELIQSILPLTNLARKLESAKKLTAPALLAAIAGEPVHLPPTGDAVSGEASTSQVRWEVQQQDLRHHEREAHLGWFLRLLGKVVGDSPATRSALVTIIQNSRSAPDEVAEATAVQVIDRRRRYPIQSVNANRRARPAVSQSRITVKADAAEQLFSVDTSTLTWAVVDSGIDAMHPAFALRDAQGAQTFASSGLRRTRVTRTFDLVGPRGARSVLAADATLNGLVDWTQALPYVELGEPTPSPPPQQGPRDRPWVPPTGPHGTHVAGILAADWRETESRLQGICPMLRLHDFRVLDNDGNGDEFSIVAALQLIRHINEQAGRLVIVGVNLSLSVPHDVANQSTGWTPVCVEADRLTRSGVVVVAAAGNSGYEGGTLSLGTGYRTVSITDPGNADSIITVGSTHRSDPHRHGVSYFSGRGPTADGRQKPDILAPGEDIDGPAPGGGLQAMHGTSQAAAHVSGVAAMLMARHRELIGRPERVKEILCRTATDLGRERAFQGHGMVDALRALQSV